MRRPIKHLSAATAVMAALVAVSLVAGPGTLGPPPGAAQPTPGGAVLGEETARPSITPATELPTASPPPDGQGGGTARPVDLLPVADAEAAALQAAVDRARATFGLNALAIGVSVDGQRGWSGASGLAPDGRTPLTGDSPFAIASVTKTFTAAIVLQLVEEEKVLLSAPVTDYLPGLAVAEGVTVEQLLNHSSGIADLLAPMRTRLNAEPSRLWRPDEVVALVGPSRFAPGSDWGYSNTNYVIAGMLVEAVSGNLFADELQRRITGPLGLDSTLFPPAPGVGYMLGASWTSAFWTSAALASDADDLVRWGDALYGGVIVGPASLHQMLDFNADGYGLGAERYTIAGIGGYGHSGLLRGYTTLLIHLPEAHLTLTVLATGHQFAPAELLTSSSAGGPSILSIALGIGAD